MPESAPRLALLVCSVLEREVPLLTVGATHIVESQVFELGLHDQPDKLRATLQTAIDALDSRNDIDAIVLVYALCGLGTAGLVAKKHRLVIPRAHDCITIYLGAKERYAKHQASCPSCYYYTPGWNRGRRVPGPEKLDALRIELLKRFDEDDVDFLLETEREQWAAHDTVTYIDLDTDDAETEAAYAQRCAEWLGWRFQRLKGDRALLEDLLWGRWDNARFQVVEPSERLAHSPDDHILRAEPADSSAHA